MSAFNITLPPGFQAQDVLAFHRRDTHSLAEQVTAAQIRKGLLLHAMPLVLDIALGSTSAVCTVHADTAPAAPMLQELQDAALNLLGLRIDPQPFTALTDNDALFGTLVRARPNLRIVQTATVFEALSWAIIGQQINLPFAIALRRTLILQAGRQHRSGLWCYPEAADVARLDVTALTSRKFSHAKAETLLRLARLIDSGQLSLILPASGAIDNVAADLLAIKGIGPWTVNYALLRGYGYADCSLHGDVAIRTALGRLLNEAVKPGLARTENILERYRPQRTMAAAHLWASLQLA